MKTIKKITASVLGAAILASFTACGENTAIVANYGGHDVSAGMFIHNQYAAYTELQTDPENKEGVDVWVMTKDGMSAEEYINSYAKEECVKYLAIVTKFDELGLEWSSIDQETLESDAEYFYERDGYTDLYKENNIGVVSVQKMLELYDKEDKIFEAYYGEGGVEEVSEKELWAEFEKQYARVMYIPVELKDGEGNLLKGSEKEARIQMAKDYVEEVTPENFIDVMIRHANFENELAAKAQGKEFTPYEYDPTLEEEAYPFETIVYDGAASFISESAIEKMRTHKELEKAYLIQEDETCYVVMNFDIHERTDVFDEVKATLLNEMKGEEFDALIEEWTAEAEAKIEWNQEALDRYKPRNIKV